MKKLASSFRYPHVRLNAIAIALLIVAIVQVVNAISIDPRPQRTNLMQRSCR